jgi:hypothetical protein
MNVIVKSALLSVLLAAAVGAAQAAGTSSSDSSSSSTSSTNSNATNMSNARSAAAAAAGAAIGQAAVGGTPYGYAVPPVPDKPVVSTPGSSCQCKVGERDGSACMIFMRTTAADWIKQNAPQTRMRASNDGRYYDAPFPLAASACAGRNVNPATIKVHWLDKQSAILEWR